MKKLFKIFSNSVMLLYGYYASFRKQQLRRVVQWDSMPFVKLRVPRLNHTDELGQTSGLNLVKRLPVISGPNEKTSQ